MKITYVIPTLGKGGAEDLIITLANALSKDNDVKVLILRNVLEDSYNVSRLDDKVNVSFLFNRESYGSTEGSITSSLETIWRAIVYYFKHKEYKSDVIHLNLTMGSLIGTFWQMLSFVVRHKPVFVETFHTNLHLLPLSRRLIFYFGWNLRKKLIYQILESDREKIERFLINKDKLSFIGFGVATEVNTLDNERYSDKFTIMTVGRTRLFEKRIGVMVETLKILIEKYNQKVELVLGGDGKDMDEIRELVISAGMEKDVTFLGYVDNPAKIMLGADLYMCAFVGDETGVSGVQAGQLGIPVVGIQTIANYDSDPILSYDKPSDLANAIDIFIKDPDYMYNYATSGQQYFEKRFSVERMIQDYKDLYLTL